MVDLLSTITPNIQQWREKLKKLENGKAPGEDQILPEMLKAENQEIPRLEINIDKTNYMGKSPLSTSKSLWIIRK